MIKLRRVNGKGGYLGREGRGRGAGVSLITKTVDFKESTSGLGGSGGG